jgi:3-isopropylmalate dehydrogenase
MAANKRLLILPGDGIGPEVMGEVRRVLDWLAKRRAVGFDVTEGLVGGASLDKHGLPITDATMADALGADAVLLGAVGGPKWDTTDPAKPRPEQGLLGMRKELELFANLRPVKSFAALAGNSTIKPEVIAGVDIVVVRELTGGVYFGKSERVGDSAYDTMLYSEAECDRLLEYAFGLAAGRRGLLHSVDKANVLESSRLWRAVALRAAARWPAVELRHMLVDNCAMQLIREPRQFDVIATENLFGDILSDEAAMLTGSIGMLPSASVGAGGVSLYEPIHGSAPDIAGRATSMSS